MAKVEVAKVEVAKVEVAKVEVAKVEVAKVEVAKVGIGQSRIGQSRPRPSSGPPPPDGPKLRSFFVPLPPPFSRGGEGPRVLGLSCEAPGLHITVREPKRAQLIAPAFKKPPKFNEKTPRERERKKERTWGRERGRWG